ncbi:MAG TPA: TIGR03936 family radical SAM-associated protein [Coriobacteriia bacterium]
MADPSFRLRVVYGKTGRLRFLSHLEVARACERAVRRAGLEYAVTQGFNQRMKMAFGPALPVGTAGLAEIYDVWLKRFVAPDAVLSALRDTTPDRLTPVSALYVGEREASVAVALTLADYEVVVGHPGRGPVRMAEALEDVISSEVLEIEHKGARKVYDLAVCLPEGARMSEDDGRSIVRLTVRMGAQGSLRPDALVREALRRAGLSDEPVSVTRLGLRPEEARA